MSTQKKPKNGKVTVLPNGQSSNEELLEIRKEYFLPTAALYYKNPIQLKKAKGNYVYDEKGTEYLDAIGGIVCNSAGHNHPKIQEALLEMIKNDEIQHTTMLYLNHHATDLAKKIVSEAPDGIDRCSFTNSGSEANELAITAARHATGETMVVNLRHGYHGGTSGVLSSCGQHTWRFRSQPTASVTSALEPYCYRCPFGKAPTNCSLECAKNVETTIQTSTHGKIAAFIAEPVMGIGGVITPPQEYFPEVTKIVHKYGGKYISDEVQTGAGRCGSTFLLTKDLGIDADMVTMAKGFGNGAPIGAVLMKSEIAESLSGKLYFNTFGGDPYQTMQALKTMEIIEEENLIENAMVMGKYLLDTLKELMKKHEIIGDVRGRGLLIGIELVKDRKTKEHATKECAELMELCKDRGLLIGKGGLAGNVIRLAPALSINKKQIDFIIQVLDESLKVLSQNKPQSKKQ
ncbi:MAG: aspartate aminotransferase family protein [Candidatus Melainabacteria bacterium]|nr:aspartate aminotransferase family protein [Candidatus Melainabacteria bacterium]